MLAASEIIIFSQCLFLEAVVLTALLKGGPIGIETTVNFF